MINWQKEVADKLTERAEKAEEGWIRAERKLGNTCPLCGWDEDRPGHIGCQCLKKIKAVQKERLSPSVARRPDRKCEFCGCNTNAAMRACCERGNAADGGPHAKRAANECPKRHRLNEAEAQVGPWVPRQDSFTGETLYEAEAPLVHEDNGFGGASCGGPVVEERDAVSFHGITCLACQRIAGPAGRGKEAKCEQCWRTGGAHASFCPDAQRAEADGSDWGDREALGRANVAAWKKKWPTEAEQKAWKDGYDTGHTLGAIEGEDGVGVGGKRTDNPHAAQLIDDPATCKLLVDVIGAARELLEHGQVDAEDHYAGRLETAIAAYDEVVFGRPNGMCSDSPRSHEVTPPSVCPLRSEATAERSPTDQKDEI